MDENSIVRMTLDPNNPPPLTDAQKVRLALVAVLSDDHVDTRDAPFRADVLWVKANSRVSKSTREI